MAEILTHTFINPKVDSADGTITGSSEWNDGHSFGGGVDGNTLVRDSTQAKGARWTDGPAVTNNTGSYSGATPSSNLAGTVVTFNGPSTIIFQVSAAIVTSNGSAAIVSLLRDGVTIRQSGSLGTGIDLPVLQFTQNEGAGTHTYAIQLATQGGATFTSSSVMMITTRLGR